MIPTPRFFAAMLSTIATLALLSPLAQARGTPEHSPTWVRPLLAQQNDCDYVGAPAAGTPLRRADMSVDRHDNVFLSTDAGLVAFNVDGVERWRFAPCPTESGGYAWTQTLQAVPAGDGGVWVIERLSNTLFDTHTRRVFRLRADGTVALERPLDGVPHLNTLLLVPDGANAWLLTKPWQQPRISVTRMEDGEFTAARDIDLPTADYGTCCATVTASGDLVSLHVRPLPPSSSGSLSSEGVVVRRPRDADVDQQHTLGYFDDLAHLEGDGTVWYSDGMETTRLMRIAPDGSETTTTLDVEYPLHLRNGSLHPPVAGHLLLVGESAVHVVHENGSVLASRQHDFGAFPQIRPTRHGWLMARSHGAPVTSALLLGIVALVEHVRFTVASHDSNTTFVRWHAAADGTVLALERREDGPGYPSMWLQRFAAPGTPADGRVTRDGFED